MDAAEIADKYNASKHPAVLSGHKSEAQVLTEFLSTFDVGGEVDGKVTREEFANYYTNLGASIDNEDYFELMIRNAWHISGGKGQAANSANRRVLATGADGRQRVVSVDYDLGIAAGDKEGLIAQLRKEGKSVKDIELYGLIDDRTGEIGAHSGHFLYCFSSLLLLSLYHYYHEYTNITTYALPTAL